MSINIFDVLNKGKVVFLNKEYDVEGLEWNKHKTFEGVYLKHLIKGPDTDNKFSCHIVKVDEGFEIGTHKHDNSWELHEVISGEGKCILADKEIEYMPGVNGVMPQGMDHRVIAEKGDMYLLAKFVPPLL